MMQRNVRLCLRDIYLSYHCRPDAYLFTQGAQYVSSAKFVFFAAVDAECIIVRRHFECSVSV